MFAGLLSATPVAFARLDSVAPLYLGTRGFALQGTHAASDNKQQKPWLSSAPTQTSYADLGKRPGAEVGHPMCDAHHINCIIAGRNVA